MKTPLLLAVLLTCASALGQAPNLSQTTDMPISTLPRAVSTYAGSLIFGPSGLTDDGTNLSYKGVVLSRSSPLPGSVSIAAGTSAYAPSPSNPIAGFLQSRIPIVPPANSGCFSVAWSNASGTAEIPGPAFLLRAAIEYPAGTFYPLLFDGTRNIAVAPGAVPVSDPLCIDSSGGQVMYVRASQGKFTASDTTPWPTNYLTGNRNGTVTLAPNVPDATGQFDGAEALNPTAFVAGSISAGGTTFTDTTNAPFNGMYVGQTIAIAGAGSFAGCGAYGGSGTGMFYCGSIVGYTSSSTVTVSPAATAGVSGAAYNVIAADKTTSGTIAYTGNTPAMAPIAIIARSANPIKPVGILGDNVSSGVGASTVAGTGSWAVQALSQTNLASGIATATMPNLPYVNESTNGETCANLTAHHAARFALLALTKKVLGVIGSNDDIAGSTAATTEACLLTLWGQESKASAPFYGTLPPVTTSTTNWLDTANQTVSASEPARLAINSWLRDGAPLDCSTGLPATVGSTSSSVVRANYYGNGTIAKPAVNSSAATCTHPASAGGTFELADSVEMNSSGLLARNGGFWGTDPLARTIVGCTASAGAAPVIVSCAGGNFTTADTGRYFSLSGSGASATATITYVSPNNVTINSALATSLSSSTLIVDGGVASSARGRYNSGDGLNPGIHGHYLMGAMAAAAPVTLWTF